MFSITVNPCEAREANPRTRARVRITGQTILGFTSLHMQARRRAARAPARALPLLPAPTTRVPIADISTRTARGKQSTRQRWVLQPAPTPPPHVTGTV